MTEVRVETSIERVAPEWEALADDVDAAPFLRAAWARAWWKAFGSGQLAILTVHRNKELTAVLPMRWRFGGVEGLSNGHTPEFAPLVVDASAALELGRALYSQGIRQSGFSYLNGADPSTYSLQSAAEQARYGISISALERTPYLDVVGDWASYECGIDHKVRSELRRRHRHLEKVGEITYSVEDGSQSLHSRLKEGFKIEGSGWKTEARTAIASRPETRMFYTELAHWAAERGWLRLSFLRLDDQPVAFEYALEHNGTYWFLKGGYDPAFAQFSPGRLLLKAMLERAFGVGLTRFDFGGLDEPFKLEWSNGFRMLVRLSSFAETPAGYAARAVEPFVVMAPHAARRLLARLKR